MGDETYGQAPVKAEGEAVSYDYDPVARSPEETIEYLQERMAALRKVERKYRRLKAMAGSGRLMIASKEGFTLVEDLDEYMSEALKMPLSKADIIREGLEQLEEAFGESCRMGS